MPLLPASNWLTTSIRACAIGLGMLGPGQPVGSLLLLLGAGYWASYYVGRGSAEITP
jgi:hypothetical protein